MAAAPAAYLLYFFIGEVHDPIYFGGIVFVWDSKI
jgi:hypothetical protein